ncbi:MAG: PAS domain S-box protein, partial [Proteobacteria bacterium]
MIAEEPMPSPATPLLSQLCAREPMLREALGSTDIWAWEYQLDQKRLDLSASTWRLFASKDKVFHQFLSFIRPEDRFVVGHSILRAVSLRRGFMLECLTLSHNALPELKIQIQANLTQTTDGLCLRGIVQNMSSLRTSAKATHDDRFRSLFQLSAVGLVYGDIEGNIVDVNEKFASLTGYDRSSIIGSSIFRFAHPADHTMTLTEQRKLLSKPNTQAFLEKRYIHKDGHTFWVQVCVSTFAGS